MGDTGFLVGISLFFCAIGIMIFQIYLPNSLFNNWQWMKMIKKEFASSADSE